MSNAICPQRVIKEAIRILSDLDHRDDIDDNISDLEALLERIDRSGITLIRQDGTHNGTVHESQG